MPHESTKLVLGRGEVYFDRFITGTAALRHDPQNYLRRIDVVVWE
jgi:hypothetical protein